MAGMTHSQVHSCIRHKFSQTHTTVPLTACCSCLRLSTISQNGRCLAGRIGTVPEIYPAWSLKDTHFEVVYLVDVLLAIAYLCKPVTTRVVLEKAILLLRVSFLLLFLSVVVCCCLLVKSVRLGSNQEASVVVGKSSEDDQDNIDNVPDTKSTS